MRISDWSSDVFSSDLALGIEARIDHRSYEAQGIGLEPQHKIGAAGARREVKGEDAERVADHRDIARKNGAAIIADPAGGLEALTHTQANITHRDLAMFEHRPSEGKEQFTRALAPLRPNESVHAFGRSEETHLGQEWVWTGSTW